MDGVRDWRLRKPSTHTREVKETLPQEVRMLIEQLRETIKDHEQRLATQEAFRNGLIGEATNKLKGVA